MTTATITTTAAGVTPHNHNHRNNYAPGGPTMIETTFALPLATAQAALHVAAPFMATKKDAQVSPALGGVQIRQGAMLATDRYSVGRYRSDEIVETTADAETGETHLIPREAVEWVQKIKRSALRFKAAPRTPGDDAYRIVFGFDGIDMRVTLHSEVHGKNEREQAFDNEAHDKNLPPVERLFPEFPTFNQHDADRRALGKVPAEQLARIAAVAKGLEDARPLLLTPVGDGDPGKRRVHVTLSETHPADFLLQEAI